MNTFNLTILYTKMYISIYFIITYMCVCDIYNIYNGNENYYYHIWVTNVLRYINPKEKHDGFDQIERNFFLKTEGCLLRP